MACCSTFMRRDHSNLFIFKQQTHAILENKHQFEEMFFFLAVLYADDTVVLSLCLSIKLLIHVSVKSLLLHDLSHNVV